MFSLLALAAIVLSVGLTTIITTWLFVKPTRDYERLVTAVKVEKYLNSWRARHQTEDEDLWRPDIQQPGRPCKK
jgi:hypothetical protein